MVTIFYCGSCAFVSDEYSWFGVVSLLKRGERFVPHLDFHSPRRGTTLISNTKSDLLNCIEVNLIYSIQSIVTTNGCAARTSLFLCCIAMPSFFPFVHAYVTVGRLPGVRVIIGVQHRLHHKDWFSIVRVLHSYVHGIHFVYLNITFTTVCILHDMKNPVCCHKFASLLSM